MAFDLEAALKEGYTKAEVADFLGQSAKFDTAAARKEGYSDDELISHLSAAPKVETPKAETPVVPVAPPKPEAKKLTAREAISGALDRAQANYLRDSKEAKESEVGRQVGLTGRMAVSGALENAGYPANAVASAIASGVYKLGAKSAAKWIEDNLGTTGAKNLGQAAANSAGLPDAKNDLEKAVQTGGRMMVGGVQNKLLQGAGEVPNVIKAAMPATTSGTGLAVDAAVGVGMEAAPGETTAVGAGLVGTALAASLAKKKMAANAAKKTAGIEAKLNNSPTPEVDAQVIKNLANDAKDPLRYHPLNDRNAIQTANSIQEARRDYLGDAKRYLTAAGIKNPAFDALLAKKEPSLADIDKVRGTPEGEAVADAALMAVRTEMLTKQKQSSRGMSLVRAGLDWVPMPDKFRKATMATLGARETREEAIALLTQGKNVKAADSLLGKLDEVPAPLRSIETLKELAAKATDANKAKAAAIEAAKGRKGQSAMSDYDLVESKLQEPVKAEQKAAMEEVDLAVRLKRAAQIKQTKAQHQALADQISKDPSLLEPSARDPRQFEKNSKALEQDILDRMKAKTEAEAAAVKAKADAQAAKEGSDAEALKIKARKISGTPGGGAYQALKEHTGLQKDDLNTVLRVAEKVPEAAAQIKKIRVMGENTSKDAIYPVTDILNTIADGLGMERAGALSTPRGALTSGTGGPEKVSKAYQVAAGIRQKIFTEAGTKAASLSSAEAKAAAKSVAESLATTSKAADRFKLIDDLNAKYPETVEIFSKARKVK